tara:strand:- start:885 stop:1172 length:288 start_codon:yes stop_codon:yes gene_type:complete
MPKYKPKKDPNYDGAFLKPPVKVRKKTIKKMAAEGPKKRSSRYGSLKDGPKEKGAEPGQRRTQQRRNRLARLRAVKMSDNLFEVMEQERRKRKSR